MFALKIVSLNVRGMADPDVRQVLFWYLRRFSAHVICLQEVHAPDADAAFWSLSWGGAASFNKHTAILILPALGSAVTRGGCTDLRCSLQGEGSSFTLAGFR